MQSKAEVIKRHWADNFWKEVYLNDIRNWEFYFKRKLSPREKENLKKYDDEQAYLIYLHINKKISEREYWKKEKEAYDKFIGPFWKEAIDKYKGGVNGK